MSQGYPTGFVMVGLSQEIDRIKSVGKNHSYPDKKNCCCPWKTKLCHKKIYRHDEGQLPRVLCKKAV